MVLDAFLVGFALSAGAVSFFSPCAVGLFPAYVGYFLAAGPVVQPATPRAVRAETQTTRLALSERLGDGIRLGGVAALGFFSLFFVVAIFVGQVGTLFLGSYLRWISIGIGTTILALGVAMVAAGRFTLHPRFGAPRSRTPASVFVFGIGYGLASLGCTLPVFLSVILASLAAGGPWGAFLVVLAYAAGMGLVMIAVTVSLSVSEGGARTYVRRIVPYVQRVSAALMAVAGGVVIYFYAVVWR